MTALRPLMDAPPAAALERRRRTSAIILHHTQTSAETTIESIRRTHVEEWGWAAIGYHYLIRRGEVLVGRPEWAIGSHAHSETRKRGWNGRSVGVALVGDYREAPPPELQLTVCEALVRTLLERYPGARILAHREAMAELGDPEHTDCPGPLPGWVAEIRSRLQAGDDKLYRG